MPSPMTTIWLKGNGCVTIEKGVNAPDPLATELSDLPCQPDDWFFPDPIAG
ncbi:MAG: hypothetical protein RLY86_1244 [Pseudomonadota bacterium]